MSAGLYLIDKERGLTSAAVVAQLKRKLNLRKVGHAGTLDPMATGLLICLADQATRFASFAGGGEKTYSGEIRFGLVTSSDDITGEVLHHSEKMPDFAAVKEKAITLTGEISQIPPQVSALKVDGQRAYNLARNGEQVELAARKVTVSSFEISPISSDTVSFVVRCSSGTYVRSLARDLGAMLGCGGCLASLRREASSPFSVSNARKLADIGASDIISFEALFPEAPRLRPGASLVRRLASGDERALLEVSRAEELKKPAETALYYDDSGNLCGLLKYSGVRWEFGVNLAA